MSNLPTSDTNVLSTSIPNTTDVDGCLPIENQSDEDDQSDDDWMGYPGVQTTPNLSSRNGIRSYMSSLLSWMDYTPTNDGMICIGIEAASRGLHGVVTRIDENYVREYDDETRVICTVDHPQFGRITVGLIV
jgi:hypothetical protein